MYQFSHQFSALKKETLEEISSLLAENSIYSILSKNNSLMYFMYVCVYNWSKINN